MRPNWRKPATLSKALEEVMDGIIAEIGFDIGMDRDGTSGFLKQIQNRDAPSLNIRG